MRANFEPHRNREGQPQSLPNAPSEARPNKRCISIIPELTGGGWCKTADSKASPRERIADPVSTHLISRRRITSSSAPARFQMAAHDFSERLLLRPIFETWLLTRRR